MKRASLKTLSAIIIGLLVLTTQISTQADSDTFNFDESEDDGFEESTLDIQSNSENMQSSEDLAESHSQEDSESNPEPYDSQKSEEDSFMDQQESVKKEQAAESKPSVSKKSYNDKNYKVSQVADMEIKTVACLSIYSKIVQDKYAFHQKLEALFSQAGEYEDAAKMKLVEKYIVNSIYKCVGIIKDHSLQEAQGIVQQIYEGKLSDYDINNYIRFDDDLILNKVSSLTADEAIVGDRMKEIQEKYSKMNDQQAKGDNPSAKSSSSPKKDERQYHGEESASQKRTPSFIETIGGNGFLGVIGVVVMVVVYFMRKGAANNDNSKNAEEVLGFIKESKVQRKKMAKEEARIKKEIDIIKKKMNDNKKAD